MAIWKLTDRVCWGNAEALASPTIWAYRCILAVGGNLENLPLSNTPLAVPEKIPYLRMAWPDTESPPREYWQRLKSLIGFIRDQDLLPVLVHCRAGQMRSPAVAALAAHLVGEGELSVMLDRCRSLRRDVCYDGNGMKRFCAAMLAEFNVSWK